MDNSPPGQQMSTIIGNLRDVRARMSTLLDAHESLNRKFAGPRPEPPNGKEPRGSDCVMSIFADINTLLLRLEKITDVHHQVTGEFTPNTAPSPSSY